MSKSATDIIIYNDVRKYKDSAIKLGNWLWLPLLCTTIYDIRTYYRSGFAPPTLVVASSVLVIGILSPS